MNEQENFAARKENMFILKSLQVTFTSQIQLHQVSVVVPRVANIVRRNEKETTDRE